MNRSALSHFRCPAPLFAVALLLTGCSTMSDREKAEQDFVDVFSEDAAVGEVSADRGITHPGREGWPGIELRAADGLDCAELGDLFPRIVDAVEKGAPHLPGGKATVFVGEVSVELLAGEEQPEAFADLVCGLRDDPDVAEATVLPQWVGRYNLSLSTPDAYDIPELYHRWAGHYDDLAEDGNGLFSVGDVTGDFQVTAHIRDWERMDLDGFPGYLDEFGVSRFIRTQGEPLEVTVAADADVDAATAAMVDFLDPRGDASVVLTRADGGEGGVRKSY